MTFTSVLLIAAGLALLIAGGELLVRGASGLAAAAGVSRLSIGLTVVAFGTSAPEMLVSVYSSVVGKPDIAVANVVGSNIFNVLLILGVCAVIRPLAVASQLIKIDVPVMIGVSLLLLALAADGTLCRSDGLLLLIGAVAYTAVILIQGKRDELLRKQAPGLASGSDRPATRGWVLNAVFLIGGLTLLVLGARWLVDGSVAVARAIGVSDVIIGLTIIAAGTSLPEVATSVIATFRGERDIAIGNVIGSNIFNILGILGVSSLVASPRLSVAASLINVDVPVMIAVAVICLPLFLTGHSLKRWEGFLFLGYYAAYIAYLIMASSRHDLLPAFSRTMILFVVPVTVLAILLAVVSEWRARRRGSVS